jgi:dienelactone hydrolase
MCQRVLLFFESFLSSLLALKAARNSSPWLWFLVVVNIGFSGRVNAQTIEVSPNPALVDEKLDIRIRGLEPGKTVVVRAFLEDKDGRKWESYAGFAADSGGVVDLSRQPPLNGTYEGISAMGLLESMQVPMPDYGRVRFSYEWSKPLVTRLVAESDGKTLADTQVIRNFKAAGVTSREVRSEGLVGTIFVPSGKGPFPTLLVLGGSEGGNSAEDVGALLASHGYVCLALAYFDLDALPKTLEEIPLEYFEKALDWLTGQGSVQSDRIGILGTSKGAEAALLIASRDRRIHAVVAYAPSSVVWSCLCPSDGKSSWSSNGAPVPFVPFEEDPTNSSPAGFPLRIGLNYQHSLKNEQAIQRATMPVELINGPVLLVSGMDDQLWPSFGLGKLIMQRLTKRRHRFQDRQIAYQNAGHLIGKAYLPVGSTLIAGGQIESGGTPLGDAKAQEDSWPSVLSFLNRALARPIRSSSVR